MTYDTTGITVSTSGLYWLEGLFPWPFYNGGTRYMSLIIWRSGVANNRAVTQELYAPGANFVNSWTGMHYLQAGDKVRMMVEHNAGVNLSAGYHSNTLIPAKLGVTWVRTNS